LSRTLKSLLTLVCLLMFAWAATAALSAGDVPKHTTTTTYTVEPGDTEWQIALKFDPQADPRAVTYWMEHHDDIGQVLTPGQVLVVPEGGK